MAIHWPTEKGTFQDGMAYVALGRCEQIEDVYIVIPKYRLMSKRSLRNLIRKHIKVDADALAQKQVIDTIDSERRMKEKSNKENNIIISYLNVRKGLIVKKEDVEKDDILMSSDIFGIGETCLTGDANVQYKGFDSIFVNVRNGQGSAVYLKNDLFFDHETFSNDKISAIYLNLPNIDLIFLYLSKQFSWNILMPVLKNWIKNERRVAILGDMNWHYNSENTEMKKYLEETLQFKQIINVATHDQGHTLDHIYINKTLAKEDTSFGTEPVYYSDHDIVQLKIPKIL